MNKYKNVYIMYAIMFLQGFVFYGPVATLFRQARGISMSEILFIEAISWIGMILLEVPWGWIADRIGYKKVLIIVNGLFFISKIVFHFANSFSLFLVERLMLSVIISGLSGCDQALIYQSIERKDAQHVFAKYSFFGTLGFVLASVLSSIMVQESLALTSWSTIFPYLLAFIITFFLVDVPRDEQDKVNVTASVKEAFSKKHMIYFVIAIAMFVEVGQVITVFLNQLKYIEIGLLPASFGIIVLMIQVIRLFAPKTVRITHSLGSKKTLIGIGSIITLSSLMLALTNNEFSAIAFVGIIAFVGAVLVPIEQKIKNEAISDKNRATCLSIYSMLGGLFAAVGNVAIGKITDSISLEAGLIACAMMALSGVVLIMIYLNREQAELRRGLNNVEASRNN